MSKTPQETFDELLEKAKRDENIIGFILGAGRGKGFATEHSDYDVIVVVPDSNLLEYKKKYEEPYYSTEVIEIHVYSLSEFKQYAVWGSSDDAHRYNFTHLKAVIDRTGEVQKMIDEKGVLPPDKIKEFVSGELDKYINLYYRSVKNHRDKNIVASHLDAAESMCSLLVIVFGIEGRLRPYNKFLEWELVKHPLQLLPWKANVFLSKLQTIVTTGDVVTQKELLYTVFELFRQHGYGKVIDGWDGYYMG